MPGARAYVRETAGHFRDGDRRAQKHLDVLEQAPLNWRILSGQLLEEPEAASEDARHFCARGNDAAVVDALGRLR